MLSGERGKTTARQQSVYSGRDKKTLYTVAKQKQFPSAGLDIMCAARPPEHYVRTNYFIRVVDWRSSNIPDLSPG